MRRQEARRQRGEVCGTLWQRISRTTNPRVLLIWAVFYFAVVAILLAGRESMPWRLMQKVDRDITARVNFHFIDQLETDSLRQKAHAAVPFIYVSNEAPLSDIQSRLTELFNVARATRDDTAAFLAEAAKRKWNLNEHPEAFSALRQYAANDESPTAWDELLKRLVEGLEGEPLVDQLGDAQLRPAGHKSQLRRAGESALEVQTAALELVTPENIRKVAQRSAAAVFPANLCPLVVDAIVQSLSGSSADKKPTARPLWRYDTKATLEAQQLAMAAVPNVERSYKAGETLVTAGPNKRLSAAELDLLKREHQAFLHARRTDWELRQKHLRFQAGMAGLVLLLTLGLACYAISFETTGFRRPAKNLALTALLLTMLAGARLIELAEWPYDLPVEFSVGLVTIAAALMTIAFGQRFAFGGGGALCALVTLASRGDLALFLTLLTATTISVFLLKEIRTRSKVILVGMLASAGAMLASASAGFLLGEDVRYALVHAACAGMAAVVAGFVVQGILPQFERIFGIATSMTLLEWCDASRPLLRLLAQNAPGTYSHSLMISQMAEEAAESVGARGLLARVGALYHDVGKASKPDYFVENQQPRNNRHDKLSPTMSMLIILGHVKDGIEMARAHGLPKILHQFIAEHHGTTVVRYFHRAACEAEANAVTKRFCDRDVPESEFRYPGPKPRSKESAILMLCDGCEGAVRALSQPTPGRIENVVHQVVMDRLNDGQFDDCDITLRELKLLERSLVKSLTAIHHARIKYPDKVPASNGRAANGDAGKSTAANGGGAPHRAANGGANQNNSHAGAPKRSDKKSDEASEGNSEVLRQA